MTLDEACTMAAQIRDHYARLDVIAIGRFVMFEELDTAPERWAISVRVDGSEKATIWSRDQLLGFSTATSPKRPAKPKHKQIVEETGAPLLF